MPAIPYANIPAAPGVPALIRTGVALSAAVVLLTADALTGIQPFFFGPQWGIFDQFGNPLLIGDSCVAFEFRDESRASDFPVENGAFASYNKVPLPYEPRITLTKGGILPIRTAFLQTLAVIKQSLTLVTVVTPEITYPSCNIMRYDYRRTSANGATLLTIDVWLEQIRIVATAAFSNTKSPNGTAAQNGGTVTPSSPSPAQSTAKLNNDAGNVTAKTSTSAFA